MTLTPTTDSAVSPVRELSPIRKALARAEVFAADYEFDSYEGCHTPSDLERLLMLDMLNGLFDDEEFVNALSRRSLDTADGVELPATNMFVRGAREDIAVMPEGEVAIEFRTGGEIERARLASRTPNTEMVVKALQWEEDEPGWWCAQPAAMIGGFGYEVRVTDSGKVRARRGRDDWAAFDGTLDEAKAAAQADFDQRIRSALASPPSPAEVTNEAQIEAVWQAVLSCPHSITGEEIVLGFSSDKLGKNAAAQLHDRIASALQLNKKG